MLSTYSSYGIPVPGWSDSTYPEESQSPEGVKVTGVLLIDRKLIRTLGLLTVERPLIYSHLPCPLGEQRAPIEIPLSLPTASAAAASLSCCWATAPRLFRFAAAGLQNKCVLCCNYIMSTCPPARMQLQHTLKITSSLLCTTPSD